MSVLKDALLCRASERSTSTDSPLRQMPSECECCVRLLVVLTCDLSGGFEFDKRKLGVVQTTATLADSELLS